jgi:heme exporter protein C
MIKKHGFKAIGILLLLYVLVGGLFIPLKTGITGVNKFSIWSDTPSVINIDIYNPGKDFQVQSAVLGGKWGFVATKTDYKDGILSATFNPKLGKERAEGVSDLYVLANKQWMAFPSAVSIRKSAGDTGNTNAAPISVAADADVKRGFPNRPILNESIRNLYYHVPMWFSMIFLLLLGAVQSVKYLRKGDLNADLRADAFIKVAVLAGFLGCATGSVWASVTWNSWWPRDPKLNGVAIGMLMYMAYLLLRSGMKDEYQRARISAIYHLFVFPIFIALIVVMPKLSGDSLHPGAGGSVGFNQYDLDNTMRMFFYPAVIGWIAIFVWVSGLLHRINKLEIQTDTPL